MNSLNDTNSLPSVDPALQKTQRIEPEEPVYLPGATRAPSPAQAENVEEPNTPEFLDSSNAQQNPIPIIRAPKLTLKEKFIALQLFEGTVQEVGEDEFTSTLRDQKDSSTPRQSATIAFDNVCDDDRELVAPGAVFYWSIGYRIEPYGQRALESNIRFRRLPAWTKSDLKKLAKNTKEFSGFFE